MPSLLRILLIAAGGCGVALWLGVRSATNETKRGSGEPLTLTRAPADLPEYGQALAAIEKQRRALGKALATDRSPEARARVLADAQRLLQRALTRDLPAHWLGTAWDFNGTSETPGQGHIACGYFVSTMLRDAGFEVERVRLAQQASGNIIRSLTDSQNTARMVGETFDDFRAELARRGPGVYVIGLDRHVGFIAQTEEGAAFIHSDGGANKCVIVEPVESSPSLRRSRWREFANLSSDSALLQKWLLGGRFPTVL